MKQINPIPELPASLQQEKIILTPDASAEQRLATIEHFLPETCNLPENLAVLRHLGVRENDIADILKGGRSYLYGEIASREHPSVKVIVSSCAVTIKTRLGKYQVFLEDVPFEDYLRRERKRQSDLAKETSERTKEDLMKEICKLRREMKYLDERLKACRQNNESLEQLCRLYKKELK